MVLDAIFFDSVSFHIAISITMKPLYPTGPLNPNVGEYIFSGTLYKVGPY